MVAPYYVEPEYWVEGYAEGDAKIAGAVATSYFTVSSTADRFRNVAATLAADLAASASAEIIFLASATSTTSVSLTTAAQRIQLGDAQINANSSASATSLAIYLTSATVNCSADLAVAALRIQQPSASASISVIFAANGRLKWEPEAIAPETWADVPDTSETWTEVA